LEGRIDETQEAAGRAAWGEFLEGKFTGEVFTPASRKPSPPKVVWPKVSVNAALADFEAMLLREFGACSVELDGGSKCLNVRTNYGCGILASLFGCEPFLMDEALDTLPNVRPMGSEAVRRLLDAGVPDLEAGFGAKVFEAAEWFLEAERRYPLVGRWVHLYHPDLQGPIDAAELVWGSEIFYAFNDTPDLLRDFLDLVTETYAAFMRHWYALVPPQGEVAAHWTLLHRGQLMVRNDSLMNLSPQTYVEFVRPLDERLFEEFGGGAIHFCGRGDHFIAAMAETRGLTGVQLSQPHLNDMETVCRATVDRGIVLLDLNREAADKLQVAGRPLRGRVQCW
jgi:hypothetical protein